MDPATEVWTLQPIVSGRYSYYKGHFFYKGEFHCGWPWITREDPHVLTQLCSHDSPLARPALATKPYVTAQLGFYGIEYEKSADHFELWALLHKSVRDGLCNTPPPALQNLEDDLARQWIDQLPREGESWDRFACRRRAMRIAKELDSHLDPHGFVKKHFLDETGSPATELEQYVTLGCWGEQLVKAVKAVPGLEVKGSRPKNRDRGFTIIHWRNCPNHVLTEAIRATQNEVSIDTEKED